MLLENMKNNMEIEKRREIEKIGKEHRELKERKRSLAKEKRNKENVSYMPEFTEVANLKMGIAKKGKDIR